MPIFKTLLQEAGQVDVAFGAQKEDSEERKNIEKWIEASTSGQDVPVKDLDEHLKNKTYIAGNKLTAADVAVFGALNTYIVCNVPYTWPRLLSRLIMMTIYTGSSIP